MHLRWLGFLVVAFLSCCAENIPGPHIAPLKRSISQPSSDTNPKNHESNNAPFSPPAIVNNYPPANADKPKSTNDLDQTWNNFLKVIPILISVIALIVSVLALRANQKRNALERPWISVKPTGDSFGWSGNLFTPIELDLKWAATNPGRTPAFLTDLSINFRCVSLPIPDEIPPYDEFKTFARMIIDPNGGSHGHETPLQIMQSDLDDILDNKKCIAFFGYAEYYDAINNKPHRTRFYCYWQILNRSLPWMLSYVPVGPTKTVEYT